MVVVEPPPLEHVVTVTDTAMTPAFLEVVCGFHLGPCFLVQHH